MKRFRENLKSLEILLGWSILEYLDPFSNRDKLIQAFIKGLESLR